MNTAGVGFADVKQRYDLVVVASRYTTLTARCHEHCGPCPKCGGTDRFVIFKDRARWFCRKCDRGGDVVDLLCHVHNCEPREALEILTGEASKHAPAKRVAPAVAAQAPVTHLSPAWQAQALPIISDGMRALDELGNSGLEYLKSRSITLETGKAFRIGFDPERFDPATKSRRPAIVIPWLSAETRSVEALKYRFIDELGKTDKRRRFCAKSGSVQTLFGTPRCSGGGETRTLIATEGEINALSLWQVTRDAGFDVLSFGGDSNSRAIDALRAFAAGQRYSRVLLWADSRERALSLSGRLSGLNVTPMCSPHGLDANDVLCQYGASELSALVAEMLNSRRRFTSPTVSTP